MRLFISYARADKATADAVVSDVHALGHEPYYDRDLTGGQRWWDTLLDQIEQCDAFIPVLSDEYRASQACHAESTWARGLGVPFMPIVTEEQSPGMFEPVIAEANWVEYDPQSRGSLADLARGLSTLPGTTPPDVVPDRPEIPLTYLTAIDRQLRDSAEIGRGQQLTIISDLRSKLGTRDEKGARELLAALRTRPEVTFEAATTIDELLQRPVRSPQTGPQAVVPAPEPTPPVSPPTSPPAAPPSEAAPVAAAAAAPVASEVAAQVPPGSTRPTAPTPPTRPPRDQNASRISGVGWLSIALTAAAGGLALVAVLAVPWTVSYGTDYGLLPADENPIPGAVGVLAVLAVLVAVAVAVLSRLRPLSLRVRVAAAAYDVLVAVLGLVGVGLLTDHDFDEPGAGSMLLAVSLILLAAVTLMPPVRPSGTAPVSRTAG